MVSRAVSPLTWYWSMRRSTPSATTVKALSRGALTARPSRFRLKLSSRLVPELSTLALSRTSGELAPLCVNPQMVAGTPGSKGLSALPSGCSGTFPVWLHKPLSS